MFGEGKNRMLVFSFESSIKTANEIKFIRPKNLIGIDDPICLGVRLVVPKGHRIVSFNILHINDEKGKVEDFEYCANRRIEVDFFEQLENASEEMPPEKLLRLMVGLYVLGIGPCIESGEAQKYIE